MEKCRVVSAAVKAKLNWVAADTLIILLAGGDKSTQNQDIRIAWDLAQNL